MTAAETAPDADEVAYLDALLARQHAILTGVANALRGDPGPLASHSHHDLAERAAATVAALAAATRSLEAATTGERLTTCDELARLSREVATLRAAYAQDLAGLRAEVRRADDERDVRRAETARLTAERDEAHADAAALRAAARAYLVAVDGWERSAYDPGRLAAFVARDDARDALRAAIGGAP